MHSLSGLKPQQSLRTSKLGGMNHALRKKLSAVQGRAGAWLMDEALQTQAQRPMNKEDEKTVTL